MQFRVNVVVSHNTCILTKRNKALCDATRLGGKYKCRKMPAVIFQNVGAKGKLLQGHRKNSCLWRKDIFHDFDRACAISCLSSVSVGKAYTAG